MGTTTELSESAEDYLEAILHLAAEKRVARARDIAQRLNVNRSSVTGAMQSLAEKGLVEYEPYEVITLTRKGEAAAQDVVRRHEALRDFLVKVLSVDDASAEKAACQMEHSLTPALLKRLVQFVKFVERCPRGGATWIKDFGYCCEGADLEKCEHCMTTCLDDVVKRKAGGGRGAAKGVSPRKASPGTRGKKKPVGRRATKGRAE